MSLPLLLAAAEAHAAEPGLVEKFGLDWKYILIQAFGFLVVAAVLYRFGIKPTITAMDERAHKIDAGLKYAEEMKAKLDASRQESAKILRTAQQEAQKVVDEARKIAKESADKQHKDATDQANALLAKAQQAMELERRKILEEARGEIARLVVATTERVLAKKLTEADRASYNESAAREITVI
ncbi:MAG: F0F1 ATP synthase subunit B [Opitutaceae bacterium]|nr:F0F1 ATP synthase subunit B [Opitutaceae bacterium]